MKTEYIRAKNSAIFGIIQDEVNELYDLIKILSRNCLDGPYKCLDIIFKTTSCVTDYIADLISEKACSKCKYIDIKEIELCISLINSIEVYIKDIPDVMVTEHGLDEEEACTLISYISLYKCILLKILNQFNYLISFMDSK
ncbi:hypothetical protein UMC2_15731 [[Clostridium] sordellii]|uniref:hypothetical protein n=1 Tax=Paraclostridium sordellii TaxID=1505 RepID=UPI0005444591|nr:hypothetical protein [Paeniclostridium sordellii]CEK34617.1 hypothetical protein UMC2_15731 [[Clostridium] sordellii] [Paeniclostridium sordellii]